MLYFKILILGHAYVVAMQSYPVAPDVTELDWEDVKEYGLDPASLMENRLYWI